MAWYIEDKDGVRKKISGVTIGSGITEIPVATETKIGGVISSNESGNLKVDENGISSIVDNLTIEDGGNILLGDSFENKPHVIEIDESIPDGIDFGFNGEGTNLNSTTLSGAIKEVNTKSDNNALNIEENKNNITIIRNGLIYYSNENILDNWYFANPINQRGLTTYPSTPSTNQIYGIDRWSERETVTYTLQDGFIRFFRNTQQYSPVFVQDIENPYLYRGKTLTGSVLYRTSSDFVGQLRMGFSYWTSSQSDVNVVQYMPLSTDWNIFTYTLTVPDDITKLQFRPNQFLVSVPIGSISSNYIDLIAAKLELGTQQTLAHRDGNGNWVLNDPPPNYAEELLKCQRYFQVIGKTDETSYSDVGSGMLYSPSASYKYISIQLPLSVPMAKKPLVKLIGSMRVLYSITGAVKVNILNNIDSTISVEGYENICQFGFGIQNDSFPSNISYFQLDNNNNQGYIILDANI